ncbi:MAG: hypothetical protein MK077_03400 [Phycisphaerales bacterium]|nr:hypothetical protein [Phycisphaerales bacterium]
MHIRVHIMVTSIALPLAGCHGPLDTSDLPAQEDAIMAEGHMDMGDGSTAPLAQTPRNDPFDPDPFIARERYDRASTLDESNLAPGASTLVPSPESPTGDPMDQPAVNVQDE